MRINYKPHNKKRARHFGFRERMKSPGGRRILSRRRTKSRIKLSV